jgi:hypothetical protein
MPAELTRQFCRDGGLKIESRSSFHDGTRRIGSNCNSVCLREMPHEVSLQLEIFSTVADCASESENISQSNKKENPIELLLVTTLPVSCDPIIIFIIRCWTFLYRIDIIIS